MNSQTLQVQLSSLIQESKRKHSDLRNVSTTIVGEDLGSELTPQQAAEHSLGELKSLPSTSETQVAAGLSPMLHGTIATSKSM